MTEPTHVRTTRAFYDAIAVDYAERAKGELDGKLLDRAMLDRFAELVDDAGPVADLGCGPGTITAYLHALGLTVSGVDLSPEMVALARRTYPDLRFDEGSMTALDRPDGSLAGIVAWYSIIHTPQERLPEVFAEFHRLLTPGGHLLVAFQVGDEPLHLDRPFGHPVSLDFNRLDPGHIADLLHRAGLPVKAELSREAQGLDTAPQAFLLARKATAPPESDGAEPD